MILLFDFEFDEARKLLESPSSTTITMDFPGLQPGLQTHKLRNLKVCVLILNETK